MAGSLVATASWLILHIQEALAANPVILYGPGGYPIPMPWGGGGRGAGAPPPAPPAPLAWTGPVGQPMQGAPTPPVGTQVEAPSWMNRLLDWWMRDLPEPEMEPRAPSPQRTTLGSGSSSSSSGVLPPPPLAPLGNSQQPGPVQRPPKNPYWVGPDGVTPCPQTPPCTHGAPTPPSWIPPSEFFHSPVIESTASSSGFWGQQPAVPLYTDIPYPGSPMQPPAVQGGQGPPQSPIPPVAASPGPRPRRPVVSPGHAPTPVRSPGVPSPKAPGRHLRPPCAMRPEGIQDDSLVWVSRYGQKYHTRRQCPGLDAAVDPYQITFREARMYIPPRTWCWYCAEYIAGNQGA